MTNASKAKSIVCLLAAGLWLAAIPGRALSDLSATTDRITYDAGSEARIRIFAPAGSGEHPAELTAIVRYEGAETSEAVVRTKLYTGAQPPAGYLTLWTIPADAANGRYDVDLEARDPASHRLIVTQTGVASFAVHRKLLRIERIELDKTFYAPGDAVGVTVVLRNLTPRPLTGLRLEFSNRYWPWIAAPAEKAKASIVPLAPALDLPASGERTVGKEDVAKAPEEKSPATHQYGVVVWDRDRRQILDIAFSSLVFIDPPGTREPHPYPSQYMYPELAAVNVKSYRQFYPAALDRGEISFDHEHTLFPPGAAATVKFRIANTGPGPWRGVRLEARLVAADGHELASRALAENLELKPGQPPLNEAVGFRLPEEPGLYRVEVRLTGSGELLARNQLELGVNPLPRSILIFCAHEDDEGGWEPLIRAAVENQVPLHLVYFTSGDAGSCDRYYQRSCGPEEALNFGAIRMDETRAALGHMGVLPDNILFFGLPDGGSGEIWYRHPAASDPYLATLLASDRAPYRGLVRPNLPYARDAVVDAVKQLIRRFSPEVIVTAHPKQEGHIDHIVNNFLVVRALQELARENAVPPGLKLLVDRIYEAKEHPATPYHYQEHVFHVSGDAAALAQEAGWYYESQGGNQSVGKLKDFAGLSRELRYREVLDWKEHQGWNDKEGKP
jgi:LmbE family N-acetylglucosaminyl deacetylase